MQTVCFLFWIVTLLNIRHCGSFEKPNANCKNCIIEGSSSVQLLDFGIAVSRYFTGHYRGKEPSTFGFGMAISLSFEIHFTFRGST